MPNITVAEAADVIPEIWHNEALGALIANLQIGRLINKDIAEGSFKEGDILHIPKRGVLTVNDKAAGSEYTTQAPSTSKVDVTLSKHREVTVLVEDPVKAQANQDLLEGYAQDASVVLAEDIETFLLDFASTFTKSFGVDGTDIAADDLTDIRKLLLDGKVPKNAVMNLILSTKDGAALLKEAKFTSAERIDSTVEIEFGQLRRYFNLNVFENQLVNVIPGTPTKTENFGFHQDAMVLAMRNLPLPPAGLGVIASIADLEGYTMRQLISFSHKDGGMLLTEDMLYGASKLRDEFGVHVKS